MNTLRVPAGDLLGAFADPAQLFARRQTVGGAHRQPHLVAALETGDPHHVELVEVRREDRQELRALQQRQRRVGGQRQHPGVEVQPAQLAVEVAVVGQRRSSSRAAAVAAGGASGVGVSRAPCRCRPVGLVSRLRSLRRSFPIGAAELLRDGRYPQPLFTLAADGLRRRRAHAESARHQQVVGRVDVAAQSRPRPGQLDGARMLHGAVPNRVRTRGSSGDAEREQRRGAGAVPVADEAARVAAGGGDRLGQFARSAARVDRLAAQRHSVSSRGRPPRRRASALFSGSRWPSGVGSVEHLRAAARVRRRQRPRRG